MPDFLLELLSEEIPARMQERARADLARLFEGELAKSGLKAGAIETYSTPRRLALIARNLAAETQAVREELKGPRTSAPAQALEGFLRKTGLTQDQLTDRDGVYFAVIDKPGRATASVLAEAVPAIVRAFPWPKSMRWGAASQSTESLRWVRPLQGIVALFGGDIVPFEIDGIASGAETVGHRFHHPGRITIGSAEDYAAKLRACHVIVDHEERESIIALGATTIAAQAGLTLVRDEALLTENAGLTEWPVPLLGSFDPAFLQVPPEVIQLTMAVNQKYFALLAPPRSAEDQELAPAFICTANIEARDLGRTIVAGNQKVLAARLSDAKFFWEQDLKVPLEEQAKKLDQIVFHEKLGTVADKVERVAKLARWLIEEGIVGSNPSPLEGEGDSAQPSGVRGAERSVASVDSASPHPPTAARRAPPSPSRGEGLSLADMAEQAARLCKADLVTGMVGEFPELQGIMGGYYARAQGLPAEVADAIRDHYKPIGQGDDVPTAPVTVAVSLADKLDTVAAFFAIGERPTGSKDPYALRRATLGIIRLILASELRVSLKELLAVARLGVIESLAKRYFIVNIAEDVARFEPIPVSPAFPSRWVEGDVFAIAQEAEPDSFVTVDDVGYPAFSRDRCEDLAVVEISSLIDLVGNGVQYFTDRIEEAERRSGIRADLIRAVIPRDFIAIDLLAALSDHPPRTKGKGVQHFRKRNWSSADDPIAILARVQALQAFVETGEGRDLFAGYKRAANILKKEGWPSQPSPLRGEGDSRSERGEGHSEAAPDSAPLPAAASPRHPLPGGERVENSRSYTHPPEEQSLISALDLAEPRAKDAVEREDFEGAMQALATLRAPVDAFFEKVTVNDLDPAKRRTRLTLLARMRDAVHQVADFSRIEG